MKVAKKSKKMMYGALSIAALLCIGAMSSMAVSETRDTKGGIVIEALDAPITNSPIAGYQGNVLISSDNPDGNDQHPTVTAGGAGTMAIAYENAPSALQSFVPIWYSTDGATWVKQFEVDSLSLDGSGVLLWPSLTHISAEGELFFTANDPVAEYGHFMGWVQDDLGNADEFKYLNAFNTEDGGPGAATAVGPWVVWLHIDDYEAYDDGPHLKYLTYNDDDETFNWPSDVNGEWCAGSYYDGESQLVTSPAENTAMSAGSQKMYMVMQHNNVTTGRTEISFKRTSANLDPGADDFLFTNGGGFGGMDLYADIEVWPLQYYMGQGELFSSADADVAASGTNVVVVYQTNDNIYGDWDIVCEYSSDSGETFGTTVIAGNHPADDTNPAAYVSGNNVYVVYVSDGNLYQVKSEDGGATWGTAEMINEQEGTVVAEYGTADISAGGIVWTDSRNGAKDIYYESLPIAVINVDTISGGMGVSATVTNSGSMDAGAVDWTISLSGPVFVGAETTGTISSLPAGGESAISTGLVFGIGPTTITVTAGGASASASGFVLGPFVLGL